MEEQPKKLSRKRLVDLFPWLMSDVVELAPSDPDKTFPCTRIPQKYRVTKRMCWNRGLNPDLYEYCIGCPISIKRVPKTKEQAMKDKARFSFCTGCGRWYSKKQTVGFRKRRSRCECGYMHLTFNEGNAREWWEIRKIEQRQPLLEGITVVGVFGEDGRLEKIEIEKPPPIKRVPRKKKRRKDK